LHQATCFDSKDSFDLRTVKPLGLKAFFISQDIIVPGRPLVYCSGRFIFELMSSATLFDRMMISLYVDLPEVPITLLQRLISAVDLGGQEQAKHRRSSEHRTERRPPHSTETRTTPALIMPRARAAPRERSITRPRTKGPRSLIRQRIEVPR